MRSFAPLTILVAVVTGIIATPLNVEIDFNDVLEVDFTRDGRYGAPKGPWVSSSRPGWYYGAHPERHPGLKCLRGDGWLCKLLAWSPHVIQCPKPPHVPPESPSDGYTQTFANLTGATQSADYLTYGLVDTIADCKTMCNSVDGCNFVNTYHDVNGKDGSTQLTCSLFSLCHTESDADNYGGQTQPDGTIDYITNSDGWCKN